jgi:hypothetical protein
MISCIAGVVAWVQGSIRKYFPTYTDVGVDGNRHEGLTYSERR